MHEFKLWAPNARKVQVKVDERVYPMQCRERGWWRATVDEAAWGSDYAFLLDDDPITLPDPRGMLAPEGVHGVSRVYDQKAFEWHDERWQGCPLSAAERSTQPSRACLTCAIWVSRTSR